MEKKFKNRNEPLGLYPDDLFDGWGDFLFFIGNFFSQYFGTEYKFHSESQQNDRKRLLDDIDHIIRSSRK